MHVMQFDENAIFDATIMNLTSAASNIFLNGMMCFTFTVISGHRSSTPAAPE
jgi:hypothetical protein